MLPVSLDCPFFITPSSCVPNVASFSGLSVSDYPFVLYTLCYQFLWIFRFWLPLRLVYPMLPVSLDCPCLIIPSSCVPNVASFSGLFVSDYPFVLCTLCCQFLWIVRFWLPLRLVYPMLPVSLDCPFLITPSSCVPYVASFSGLSVFDYPFVLCTLCYQFQWIVSFWLPLRLVDHMLPVSLDCQFCITPSSCVPYFASFSGLSVLITPSSCCQFLWIVRFYLPLRLVYPMLPVSLDCPFLITPSSCVTYATSFSGLSVSDYPFVLWTLCCQFLSIVSFVLPLRLVYPMLPVSLDCPFLITPSSCVPNVASFSGLSVSDYPFVLCTLCYQFLWIVSFWLPLRLVDHMLPVSLDCQFVLPLRLMYPILPVSLDCQFWLPLRLVASFSGLSVFDYPFVLCTLCYQSLWIVSFWLPFRLVYPMLPVSLDCLFLITPSSCVPYIASFSGLSVFDYPFVLLPVFLDCLFLITPSSCVPYVASFSGLFVFDYPFFLCTLCCQFLWIVRFWLPLRLVYPMLPVSLDFPFLITPSSCVPYVASFSGLSVFDYPFVLCTLCYQFLWIVSFCLPLRLVDHMLPVSLDCQFWLPLRLVASFSGLSVFDYPFVLCTLCYQFLWIVSFWLPLRLVYPMMLVSLDC